MKKSITFFDPRCTDTEHPDGQKVTVTANTHEEYAAHRAAILDPERGITLIDPPELPEAPDPAWFTPEPDISAFLEGFAEALLQSNDTEEF